VNPGGLAIRSRLGKGKEGFGRRDRQAAGDPGSGPVAGRSLVRIGKGAGQPSFHKKKGEGAD